MRFSQIGMVALMAALGPLACSGEGSTPPEASGATVAANANGDPKGGDHGQPGNDETLDDLQIATVMHVVNQGEIREARFALKRAARPDVQDFAKRMETEHTKADEMLRALFADAMDSTDRPTDHTPGWDPDSPPDNDMPIAPSQVSRLFQRQTVLDLQQLRPITPPNFDLGYITKQVAAHAGVLGVIDQMLLPSVERPELRQLIEENRTAVVMHLDSATTVTQTIIGEAK